MFALGFAFLVLAQAGGAGPRQGGVKVEASAVEAAVARSLRSLERESAAWSREKHCFSCHHNGDAARALFEAKRRGLPVKTESLAETLVWLSKPADWSKPAAEKPAGGAAGGADNLALARLQFANAALAAVNAGLISDHRVVRTAAAEILKDQADDGLWRVDDSGFPGAPVTYGARLATLTAIRVLEAADNNALEPNIERAYRAMYSAPIESVLDAAVALLTLAGDPRPHEDLRKRAIELIRKAQNRDGGWGPFAESRSEPFDTALVVLALAPAAKRRPELAKLAAAGAAHLVQTQTAEGLWPATTRPAGSESYAEQTSTRAWATLALMAFADSK